MKKEVLTNAVKRLSKALMVMSLLTLLGAGGAFAQVTMGVGSVTAKAGDTVNVPITVTNFSNIGAISLKLGYNSTATKFVGITGAPAGVTFTSNAANNVITLAWFDATASTPINLGTGTLLNLRVVYNGGNGAFTFDAAQSEITNASGTVIPVTYSNGAVSPIALGLTIGSAQGIANQTVTVPVNATNFNSVGAVSLKIQYDPTVLQFDSVANAPASMQFTKGVANGVITLGWFDATGTTPVSIGNAKLFDLKFTYKGGTSAVTFLGTQSEVTNATGVAYAVQYTGGQVTPAPGEALTLSLPTVSLTAGSAAVMPLNVEKFKSIGAISIKIQYNAAVLTFNNISNAAVTGISATANNGVLTLTWFDATGNTPMTVGGTTGSGKLADLNFTYNGGTTALTFNDAQTEIANGSGVKVPATFKNGSVAMNVKPVFVSKVPAKLDTVKVNLGYKILFKVTANDQNNDTLTYAWYLDNVQKQSSKDSTYQLAGISAKGSHKLVVVFSDNGGLKDSVVWNFIVADFATDVNVVTGSPKEFSLGQNYPNPFNPSTTIKFALPKAAPVTLEIYNVLGAKVRTLLSGAMMSASNHNVVWNGKDDNGANVASGMYLYRISADKFTATMKMMLMK